LVGELRHRIDSARPLPLSASSTINKDDVLALIDEIQARMPDELRSARWLLKEREEFRAKMRREGDEIVALARNRAEQMVQRTQVVKAAEARARKVLEAAEAESRRLRLEAEDYCDQKLGSFENVLQRTLQQVGAGRAKLQGNLLDELGAAVDPAPPQAVNHQGGHPEAQAY
jgi:cell division septum initiation protein DivIVA